MIRDVVVEVDKKVKASGSPALKALRETALTKRELSDDELPAAALLKQEFNEAISHSLPITLTVLAVGSAFAWAQLVPLRAMLDASTNRCRRYKPVILRECLQFYDESINGRQVLVQERIPGVGLNVAWPYLSQEQKEAFRQQAREILGQLHVAKPTDGRRARSHVVPDPNN
ncbi:hypothetical protein QBC44DRAFT_400116 [Cladorrhinum sp. PSN332]|nr:hypothetical protein QBC44DRAFT_400116 [Cladorrhinum sp. PSN332]